MNAADSDAVSLWRLNSTEGLVPARQAQTLSLTIPYKRTVIVPNLLFNIEAQFREPFVASLGKNQLVMSDLCLTLKKTFFMVR